MKSFIFAALVCSANAFVAPAAPISARRTSVEMSSRREAMAKAAGLVAGAVPFAAGAVGGDSPPISFFGIGGSATPFNAYTDPMMNSQNLPKEAFVYKENNNDVVTRCQTGLKESSERFGKIGAFVDKKEWTNARTEIRLQMGVLKKYMYVLNEGNPEATKAYKAFKLAMDDFDYDCVVKDQGLAKGDLDKTLKALDAYKALTL